MDIERYILILIISISATAVIAFFCSDRARDFLKRKFSNVKSFCKRISFLKETDILGIKKIYRTRTEVENENPFFSLHVSTELSSVKDMGMSLARIKNLGDERIRSHLKCGCKFEFLLLDPSSPFMKQRTYQENPDLIGETNGFINWIENTFSTSEYRTQIDVWIYDLMPTMAISIINDNLLLVNPYSLLRRNQEFPVIEIKKGGTLFSLYKDEYEKVRGHAKTRRVFP
ncbi:MAG: hypothetical protein ABSB80_11380 [Methanoregula sp.]|jgi:hypothetical protein|uniref:hypothetical protein n=1 Tax=Methanoregula sp. TaxID=2052170 RepID=UPI003D0EA89A